ncbi:MAG: TonB-dependent receptor [Steroidobacteraceae bacterium]
MTTRIVALLLSCAATVAISTTAFGEPAPAPAPAAAASPSEEGGIQEIVVTAEKRQENLEQVAVSVTAVTSKERDLIGIESFQDITNFTPGLAYNTYLDRAFIRGVGRETNDLSTQAGVATYSDGQYNTSVVAASGDSMFLDRVEILRGPQSTLYGRNSIGGTINSISKRPTADWEAEVRANFGNYGLHNFEGSVSGPITDTMRIKFAGYRNTQDDGYFRNVFNGNQTGGYGNYFYWEGQLEWDITPDVEFWLKGAQLGYNQSYLFTNNTGSYDYAPYPVGSLGPGAAYGVCGFVPGACGVFPAPIATTPANAAVQNPGNQNIRDYSNNSTSNATLSRTYQVTPQLTWHTPWAADVKYVGGYTTYYYQLYQDNDDTSVGSYIIPTVAVPGSPCYPAACPPLTVYPVYESGYVENKKYFSNEINVTSHSDSNLQWIAGLYQYHENYSQPVNVAMDNQVTMNQLTGTPCAAGVGCINNPYNLTVTGLAAPNPNNNIYYASQDMHGNSYAAFVQTDWKFQPTWKLTTGVRYTEDFLAGSEYVRELCFGIPSCLLFPATFLPAEYYGAFTPVNDITSVEINMGPYRGVTHLPVLEANGNWGRGLGDQWDAVTGTMGVEWTPNESFLGYGKYSRGYKSGGFNAGWDGQISANPESKAEHIDAFEVGAKQVWKTFQVNSALYFYNYYNLQIPLEVQPPSPAIAYSSIINLGKVVSYGAEFETIWQPVRDLQFLLNYSYMDATIRSNQLVQNAATGPVSVTAPLVDPIGQTVPESPRNRVTTNGNYTWHFTPGLLNYSLSYIWKSATYGSIFNEPYNLAPKYSQMDSRLTWTDAADKFTIFAYVKNLQNKTNADAVLGYYVTQPAPGYPNQGTTWGLTPPRLYGVEVQYRIK